VLESLRLLKKAHAWLSDEGFGHLALKEPAWPNLEPTAHWIFHVLNERVRAYGIRAYSAYSAVRQLFV
jgi:hypothetical protein